MVAIERELAPLPAPSAPVSADAIPLKLRRRGGTPCQVFALTFIGTIVLALFASSDLASWTERLGDGPAAIIVQKIAAEWDDRMTSLDLTRPPEALRNAFRRLLDWQWEAEP